MCASCNHCQLYKTNGQQQQIAANYAFDLLQFPKSNTGNVAALVMVDHCSKWPVVVPIKDKRASTVSNAFKNRILPLLPTYQKYLLGF